MTKDSDKKKEKKHRTFKLNLLIGIWKSYVPFNQRNFLIAEALNLTVVNENLKILGYLITERNVYLVVKCPRNKIKHCLNYFEESLAKEIMKFIRHEFLPCRFLNKEDTSHNIIPDINRLFKICSLKNENLVKMITGHKVVLPYYNPVVSKLESLIDNYNFCSALDYTGAIGPVFVDKHK